MPQADNQKSPEVFVFFGMIATGKSTIAQAWSWKEQLRCYNSDWVRKELAGVDPSSTHHESMERGIYTKEFSTKTYTTLLERAADRLRQGDSVVSRPESPSVSFILEICFMQTRSNAYPAHAFRLGELVRFSQ